LLLGIDACDHPRLLRHTAKQVASAYREIELAIPYLKAAVAVKCIQLRTLSDHIG
jgi:hypothetical protein